MGRLTLLLALMLSLTVSACALKPAPVAVEQPDVAIGTGDRTDCQAIYGTSFRSDAERDWFTSNCTQWPYFNPTPAPQAAASIANYVPTQTCDQIRGKPYSSEGQHQWYLANCLGTSPAAVGQVAAQPGLPGQPQVAPQPGTLSQPQVAAGPDRTNCDEIRGTPYRSPTERQWYLGKCMPAPTPAAQAPGPVAAIPLTAPQAAQPLIVPVPGSPGR